MKSEDIAKLAGVSRSTVSRVINNYPNVPEATKEKKVMKIIKEHNYMPNTFARTLAGKKSNTIGLFFVITGETYEDSKIARNDYFSSYLSYLVDEANGMDYYVLVNTISEAKDYDKINQAFFEKRIDGAVIIGTQKNTLDFISVDSLDGPLVMVDYSEEVATDGVYVVNSDDQSGIEEAVSYLRIKGHRRIGFIKGNDLTRSSTERYEGYVKAMAKYKMPIDRDYIIEGEFSAPLAYKNVMDKMNEGKLPTAYISSNDYMAIEIMKGLKEAAYDVPESISIIGFDNVHSSEQSDPPLTTLCPRYRDMAKNAVAILDAAINSQRDIEKVMFFDVDLIERSSCKDIN